MNSQPIEKRVPYSDKLDVHSIFYTIQGEGPFCGTPAVFIRLAGCNLQCPGCDTEYTEGRKQMSIRSIVEAADLATPTDNASPRILAVITGGEPFRQVIFHLITELCNSGFYVQVESNGTLPVPPLLFSKDTSKREGAYLVISPKTGKINPDAEKAACALKYVAKEGAINPDDGLPYTALDHTANPMLARPSERFKGQIYLQPMDEKDESVNVLNMHACVLQCLKFGYTLQLQIHKLIGVD